MHFTSGSYFIVHCSKYVKSQLNETIDDFLLGIKGTIESNL